MGLLKACRAAVVLASTAGLEALLHGCTLGVLEIPGRGFIYDYVESGAALGLRLDADLPLQVQRLMAPDEALRQQGAEYAVRNLAAQGMATVRLVELIRLLLTHTDGESDIPGKSPDAHARLVASP